MVGLTDRPPVLPDMGKAKDQISVSSQSTKMFNIELPVLLLIFHGEPQVVAHTPPTDRLQLHRRD